MLQVSEYNIQTHHLYVNFCVANDNVIREEIYEEMIAFGIPRKLDCLIRMAMIATNCSVKVSGGTFEIEGLRQGDCLPCQLFNIAMECVIMDTEIQIRGSIFDKLI